MTAEESARSLGIEFPDVERGYLNLCIQAGSLLYTSGHTSDRKGMLGRDLDVEEGYAAARECAVKILQTVHAYHGGIDDVRLLKLLGCVWSHHDFAEQHLVMNGASDLFHSVFGMDRGYHARSALGFAALPNGAAVEVEAIFEIVDR